MKTFSKFLLKNKPIIVLYMTCILNDIKLFLDFNVALKVEIVPIQILKEKE